LQLGEQSFNIGGNGYGEMIEDNESDKVEGAFVVVVVVCSAVVGVVVTLTVKGVKGSGVVVTSVPGVEI
jgi:hypothetical protein